MRLIDADALIEEIARIPDLRTLSTKTIGKAINKMATIDPQPHWIPCSERYPDIPMKTLITTEWGCERTVEVSYWDKDRKWGIITNNVIAWMPLPSPYREGADNERVR